MNEQRKYSQGICTGYQRVQLLSATEACVKVVGDELLKLQALTVAAMTTFTEHL